MSIVDDVMKKNAVMLQEPSMIVAIRVDLNLIQRKFYDALLYIAKKDLEKNAQRKRHKVSLAELKLILQKAKAKITDKNNKYYIDALLKMQEKSAEYNILAKDKGIKVRSKFSVLSEITVVEKIKKSDEIYFIFEFPERVRLALLDPNGVYANINLVIVMGLESKYAVVLYKLVKDYQKAQIPEMTMQNFKQIFGIEDKYDKRIDRLKERVLDVAVNELNNNENIDFLVDYKLKKTGRKYTHIKFLVKPKPAKIKLEQQKEKLLENKDLLELLPFIKEEFRNKKICVSLLLGALEKKDKEYIKAQIDYVNQKSPKNYCGYLRNAIEKDYAGVEVVELELEEKEDWKKEIIKKQIRVKIDKKIYVLVYIGEEVDDDIFEVRFENIENPEDLKWARLSKERLEELANDKK